MNWTFADKAIAAFISAWVAKALLWLGAYLGVQLPAPSPAFTDWLTTALDATVNGVVAAVMVYYAKNAPKPAA